MLLRWSWMRKEVNGKRFHGGKTRRKNSWFFLLSFLVWFWALAITQYIADNHHIDTPLHVEDNIRHCRVFVFAHNLSISFRSLGNPTESPNASTYAFAKFEVRGNGSISFSLLKMSVSCGTLQRANELEDSSNGMAYEREITEEVRTPSCSILFERSSISYSDACGGKRSHRFQTFLFEPVTPWLSLVRRGSFYCNKK